MSKPPLQCKKCLRFFPPEEILPYADFISMKNRGACTTCAGIKPTVARALARQMSRGETAEETEARLKISRRSADPDGSMIKREHPFKEPFREFTKRDSQPGGPPEGGYEARPTIIVEKELPKEDADTPDL